MRIAALNTGLTTLYLVVILPLFGAHLPRTKTMIGVAFVVGLLPVVGNLVSKTIMVIVSLSVSLAVAIASLVFLVIIHKLEDFLKPTLSAHRFTHAPGSCSSPCWCWRPRLASSGSLLRRFTMRTCRMSWRAGGSSRSWSSTATDRITKVLQSCGALPRGVAHTPREGCRGQSPDRAGSFAP